MQVATRRLLNRELGLGRFCRRVSTASRNHMAEIPSAIAGYISPLDVADAVEVADLTCLAT